MRHTQNGNKKKWKILLMFLLIIVGIILLVSGIIMMSSPKIDLSIIYKQVLVKDGSLNIILGLGFIIGGFIQLSERIMKGK